MLHFFLIGIAVTCFPRVFCVALLAPPQGFWTVFQGCVCVITRPQRMPPCFVGVFDNWVVAL